MRQTVSEANKYLRQTVKSVEAGGIATLAQAMEHPGTLQEVHVTTLDAADAEIPAAAGFSKGVKLPTRIETKKLVIIGKFPVATRAEYDALSDAMKDKAVILTVDECPIGSEVKAIECNALGTPVDAHYWIMGANGWKGGSSSTLLPDGSTSLAGPLRVDGPIVAPSFISKSNGIPVAPRRYATYSVQITGDGSSNPYPELPFPPSLALVKLNSAGGYGEIWGRHCGFNGRFSAFRSIGDQANSQLFDVSKTVPGSWLYSYQNNATAISVFSVYDPDEVAYISRAFRGVLSAGKVIRVCEGRSVKFAIIKRDNTTPPWFLDQTGGINAAGTNTCTAKFESDGTLIATNDADLLAGESTSVHAFVESEYTQIIDYAGGKSPYIQTRFDDIEAVFIVPWGAYSVEAAFWCYGRPGSLQPLVSLGNIAGGIVVSGGAVKIATNSDYNLDGRNYKMLVFRKIRPVVDSQITTFNRPKTLNLGPSTYLDCGTDNSLTISGDQTQEFWGTVVLNGRKNASTGGNAEVDSRALLTRCAGTYGAAGTCTFGLWAAYIYNNNSFPGYYVSAADKFLFTASGQSNFDLVIDTCERVMESRLAHIVVTASASGTIKLYVDGKLARIVATENSAFARTGANGHRTVIGGHQGPSAVEMANNQLSFAQTRIYSRVLTDAEVAANYQACRDGVVIPTTDFLEEWLAEKFDGAKVPATRRSANDGVLVGTAAVLA